MVTSIPAEWQASPTIAQRVRTQRAVFLRMLRTSGIWHLHWIFTFEDARAEDNAVAIVMQFQREDEHVPNIARAFFRKRQTAKGSIDVGFACVRDGADDLLPVLAQFGKFFEQISADEP